MTKYKLTALELLTEFFDIFGYNKHWRDYSNREDFSKRWYAGTAVIWAKLNLFV